MASYRGEGRGGQGGSCENAGLAQGEHDLHACRVDRPETIAADWKSSVTVLFKTFGAICISLGLLAAYNYRTASDEELLALGMRKLNEYLAEMKLTLKEVDPKECGLYSPDNEPKVYKLFSCGIPLDEGMLLVDVAFYRTGGIFYSYAEVRE
jgi:hypothetical protein